MFVLAARRDRPQAHPLVAIEEVVLDRDDRLDHRPVHLVQRHLGAVLVEMERGEECAVAVIDQRPLGERIRD